ncbi:hypothetical protein HMI54_006603 [Coelomomyces lativittatus]|nr:hypothetical protein HMI56_003233 [Coelomomyces lativittatus]KAJ1504792.1 hypothetical protein HMI54_006603 [Coelomomyces lativittatus]
MMVSVVLDVKCIASLTTSSCIMDVNMPPTRRSYTSLPSPTVLPFYHSIMTSFRLPVVDPVTG